MSAAYPPDDDTPSQHREGDERHIIDRVIDRIIGENN